MTGLPVPRDANDPMTQVREWLPENDDPDRPQMTLTTHGREGFPAARTVLLSELTPAGFVFHTDAASAKTAELALDDRVCLVLLWPGFTRQLVVQGTARRLATEDVAEAYRRRSPYLRQLAWLNDADLARLPDTERRARWAAALARDPDGPATAPPGWTGFEVSPCRLVFWESAADTASRRTEHRRHGSSWTVDHLPG